MVKKESYLTYEQAVAAVRALEIRTVSEYAKKYKMDPLLRSRPDVLYQEKGWVDWATFLRGYSQVFYQSATEAMAAARALGLTTQKKYQSGYYKDRMLPSDPTRIYGMPWSQFLGGGRHRSSSLPDSPQGDERLPMVRGDIFDTPHRHIAFAVNMEGDSNYGFARAVAKRGWPELAQIVPRKLGETVSKQCGDKTYHALVCHSLQAGGWAEAGMWVTTCLDSLDVPDDETIAIVFIGNGDIGRILGADTASILDGMRRSKKKLVVYSL